MPCMLAYGKRFFKGSLATSVKFSICASLPYSNQDHVEDE